jgi:hypothetical protein
MIIITMVMTKRDFKTSNNAVETPLDAGFFI